MRSQKIDYNRASVTNIWLEFYAFLMLMDTNRNRGKISSFRRSAVEFVGLPGIWRKVSRYFRTARTENFGFIPPIDAAQHFRRSMTSYVRSMPQVMVDLLSHLEIIIIILIIIIIIMPQRLKGLNP